LGIAKAREIGGTEGTKVRVSCGGYDALSGSGGRFAELKAAYRDLSSKVQISGVDSLDYIN